MNKRFNGLIITPFTYDLCRTNKSILGIPNLNLVVSRQCKLPRGTLYILKHETSADIVTYLNSSSSLVFKSFPRHPAWHGPRAQFPRCPMGVSLDQTYTSDVDSLSFLAGPVRGQNARLRWRPMIGQSLLLPTCDPIWSFRQRCSSLARASFYQLMATMSLAVLLLIIRKLGRERSIDRRSFRFVSFSFVDGSFSFRFVSVQLSRSFCIPLRFSRSFGCPIGARNEVFLDHR
jgi:hypothetical protein